MRLWLYNSEVGRKADTFIQNCQAEKDTAEGYFLGKAQTNDNKMIETDVEAVKDEDPGASEEFSALFGSKMLIFPTKINAFLLRN